MFLLIGGGEHAGSGVARIRQGWASRHWRSPSLELTLQPDRVRLTLPMVSLIPEESLSRLKDLFGDEISRLNANELQAVATALIENGVSNARLQELIDIHPSDITRMLIGLCERGFLSSDKNRRWASYHLTIVSDEYSRHLHSNSPHLEHNLPHLEHSLPQIMSETSNLSPIEGKLRTIANPVASNRKASHQLVRSVILSLCSEGTFSSEQIASLLNRTRKNIRDRYLGPMVAEGLLELLYPNSPNRPDQAYKATKHKNEQEHPHRAN
jgi:ATP-dependent DNA helicase RecG